MEHRIVESSTLLKPNEINPEVNVQPNSRVSNKSRTILWHIIFWGFLINYMIRFNTNIAIVAMVLPRKSSNNNLIKVSECFNHSTSFQNDSTNYVRAHDTLRNGFSIERSIMDLFEVTF